MSDEGNTLTPPGAELNNISTPPTVGWPTDLPLPDLPTSDEVIEHKKAFDERWDADLLKAYNSSQERQAREERNNPSMPPIKFNPEVAVDARITKTLEETAKWGELSKKDRQNVSFATKNIEQKIADARALGLEVKTAADLAALNEMMGEGAKAAPDPQVERSLSTFSKLAPGAKSPHEAAEFVQSWVDHVSQHGTVGMRNLVQQGFGIDPKQLLTQADQAQIAAQFHGVPAHVLAMMAAGTPAETAQQRAHADVQDYIAEQNIDEPTRQRMIQLINAGKIPNGSAGSMLRAAHFEALRYSNKNSDSIGSMVRGIAKPRANTKKASAIDATLAAIAAKRMGKR